MSLYDDSNPQHLAYLDYHRETNRRVSNQMHLEAQGWRKDPRGFWTNRAAQPKENDYA